MGLTPSAVPDPFGCSDEHSDVDLLVVKTIQQSRIKDKVAMRAAWWPLLREGDPLPFEMLLISPVDHEKRLAEGGGFYSSITRNGLKLA